MRHFFIFSALTVLLTAGAFQAQTPQAPVEKAPPKPALNGEQLAIAFVDRFNALSDWHLTYDGKEDGLDQAVDRMMELFAPDIIAEIPPHDEKQLGPVQVVGLQNLRKWLDKIARTQVDIKYFIKRQTYKEFEGEWMVFSKPLPWGGLGVSSQIFGSYAQRTDRKRFMQVGGVFAQHHEDGKIYRLRFILAEKDEITDLNASPC
jgi:hypothetical protein